MLIPGPDTRVVELRIPDVPGTPPEVVVDSVAAVDVAGDGVSRLVRPADRLHRPAPGPVLNAAGRPLSRTVEGYLWGGMIAGRLSTVVWALLFPFTLVNAAAWMLPPTPTGSPAARWIGTGARAVLRLAGLLLTVVLIGQLGALSAGVAEALPLLPWAGVLTAMSPVLLVVCVLGGVSSVRWRVNAGTGRPAQRPNPLAGLPGAGAAIDPAAPALRAPHLVAALAMLAWMTLDGVSGPAGGAASVTGWWCAAALLGLAGLATLALDDPSGTGPWRALSPLPRRIGLAAAVAVVLAAAVIRLWIEPNPLTGSTPAGATMAGDTVVVVAIALAGCCVLLGLLLVPAALLARGEWTALPAESRPWAGGWLAAPVLVLAAAVGIGIGAGLSVIAGLIVRGAAAGTVPVPAMYQDVMIGWGVTGALGVLLAVGLGAAAALRGWLAGRSERAVPPEVPLLHAGRPADAALAARAWWWAAWQRRHAHHAILTLTAAVPISFAVSALLRRGDPRPAWSEPLSVLGLLTLIVFLGALLRSLYLAGRRPLANRRGGALIDLLRYWPRAAHPVVPPCPALKAVPELADRAAEYLDDPSTRVVLAGYGHGGVLAVAVASRLLAALPERDLDRVGLLIAGAPVRWAHARAFPAVLPATGLAELYADLNGRWRSLCRGTDPVGGGATTWRRQEFDGTLIGVGLRPDGTEGALPPAIAGPTGALVLGGDHWLPDPQHGPIAGRRWSPGLRTHGDYCADPEWDRAVACAAGLALPGQKTTEFPVFRLPARQPAAG